MSIVDEWNIDPAKHMATDKPITTRFVITSYSVGYNDGKLAGILEGRRQIQAEAQSDRDALARHWAEHDA